jgi:hypothetical protein
LLGQHDGGGGPQAAIFRYGIDVARMGEWVMKRGESGVVTVLQEVGLSLMGDASFSFFMLHKDKAVTKGKGTYALLETRYFKITHKRIIKYMCAVTYLVEASFYQPPTHDRKT